MSEYSIKPLGAAIWDAFAQLAERHNGVWNGCWCTWFHPASAEKRVSPEGQPRLQAASGSRGKGPRGLGLRR